MNRFYSRYQGDRYSTLLPALLIAIDISVIGLTSIALLHHKQSALLVDAVAASLIFTQTLTWVLSGLVTQLYSVRNLGTYTKILLHSTRTALLHCPLVVTLGAQVAQYHTSTIVLVLSCALSYVGIVSLRLLMLRMYRAYRNLPGNQKKAIILGLTPRGINLSHYFDQNPSVPHKFVGFFDNSYPSDATVINRYLGRLDDVQSFCLEYNIDEIYYALANNKTYLKQLSDFADKNFIYLGIIPEIDSAHLGRKMETRLLVGDRIPVISYRRLPPTFSLRA